MESWCDTGEKVMRGKGRNTAAVAIVADDVSVVVVDICTIAVVVCC